MTVVVIIAKLQGNTQKINISFYWNYGNVTMGNYENVTFEGTLNILKQAVM